MQHSSNTNSDLDSILLEFSNNVQVSPTNIVELWSSYEKELSIKERLMSQKNVIAGGSPDLNTLILRALQKYVKCLGFIGIDTAQVYVTSVGDIVARYLRSPATRDMRLITPNEPLYARALPIWCMILLQELFSEPKCAEVLDRLISEQYNGDPASIEHIVEVFRRVDRYERHAIFLTV
jgi:hypothetical protein